MDSQSEQAFQCRVYLRGIDVGRMVVGSEVIYHIALRKGEPVSLSGRDSGLFFLGPESEGIYLYDQRRGYGFLLFRFLHGGRRRYYFLSGKGL